MHYAIFGIPGRLHHEKIGGGAGAGCVIIGCFFSTFCPLLLLLFSDDATAFGAMVQNDEIMIVCCVGHLSVGREIPGLSIAQLSLSDFKLSCHREANEQDLNHLVSMLGRQIRNIVFYAQRRTVSSSD